MADGQELAGDQIKEKLQKCWPYWGAEYYAGKDGCQLCIVKHACVCMYFSTRLLRRKNGVSFQTASTPRQICDPIPTSRLKTHYLCPNPMEPWHLSNRASLELACATSASLSPSPLRSRESTWHSCPQHIHTSTKVKVIQYEIKENKRELSISKELNVSRVFDLLPHVYWRRLAFTGTRLWVSVYVGNSESPESVSRKCRARGSSHRHCLLHRLHTFIGSVCSVWWLTTISYYSESVLIGNFTCFTLHNLLSVNHCHSEIHPNLVSAA